MLAWCYSMCYGWWCYEENASLYHKQAGRISANLFPRKLESLPRTCVFFPRFVVSLQLSTTDPMVYMSFSSFDIFLMFRMCEYKVSSLKIETHLFLQPRFFISLILNRSGSSWGRGTFSMDAYLLWYSFSSSCPFHHLNLDPTRHNHQETAQPVDLNQ